MNDAAQSSSLSPQSSIAEGDWVYVLSHQTTGKVIEKSCLWENTSFRVWIPSTDSIVRVHSPQLSPTQSSVLSPHHLSYIAAAARVADGLPQVRNYRLNLLAQEERSFQEQLDQKAHAYPELSPLIVIRVESSG